MPLTRTSQPGCPLQVRYACNWRRGVTPGDKGSSLIQGHAYARGSSQFNWLVNVVKGNLVKIKTNTGRVLTFKVTRVDRNAPVHLSERMLATLRSHYGPPRIVINTCNADTYNFDEGQYEDGILIFAEPVHQR